MNNKLSPNDFGKLLKIALSKETTEKQKERACKLLSVFPISVLKKAKSVQNKGFSKKHIFLFILGSVLIIILIFIYLKHYRVFYCSKKFAVVSSDFALEATKARIKCMEKPIINFILE